MAKAIILTPVAEADLMQVVEYLTDNWGISVSREFLDRFEEVSDIIAISPQIYPLAYKKQNIRKCVLTRHNIIYFKEYKDRIDIITIFDSRMDPKKLRDLLR